ncbi:MAG: NCS2 family permease [Clostridia bacterium]|nr:NCS2 family permease [Clostridia bacterium]
MFRLKENGTTVRTEIVAGLTTFMTMSYIVVLNPNILTNFGIDGGQGLWNAVFMATCLAAAIGTAVMALYANKPFVMAPGMGLNSFFAVVVANLVAMTGATYLQCYQGALVIILIEGIVFILLSVLRVREKIVEAIPLGIRLSIGPAIGMMLLNIGFGSNAGIYAADGSGPFYVLRDFFGALTPSAIAGKLGSDYGALVLTVVTMLFGLFLIIMLNLKHVKGSVLFGMIGASAFYWAGEAIFFGIDPFESLAGASFIPPFADLAQLTLFKLDFGMLFNTGVFTAITLIITFCMIDMFDTIGTLIGAAGKANMLDESGNMPRMKEALTADAVGTIAGSLTGTPTVTTFVESATGVEAGGRTGLTALTGSVLFLLCIFISPLVALIPPAATSAALIYTGIIMLGSLKNLKFDDPYQLIPAALMLIAMPVSGSIGQAIGLGMISFTVMKLFSGKAKEVSVLTYVISAIFLVKFFLVV